MIATPSKLAQLARAHTDKGPDAYRLIVWPPKPTVMARASLTTARGLTAGSLLDHIATIGGKQPDPPEKVELATVLSIGAGLPRIPRQLVTRIQAGEFVDMAELLPGDKSVPGPRRE